MYMVIRQYTVDPTNVDEVVSRMQAGYVPLINAAQGFLAFTVVDGGKDGLLTVSTFRDQAAAEASLEAAHTWMRPNLGAFISSPPQVVGGEILIRQAKEDGQFGYGILRRYDFKPSDVPQAVRLVQDGLLPQVAAEPGFASYLVVDGGDGVAVSMSAFADRATAEESSQRSLAWAREHLAPLHPQAPQIIAGEIKLRHG